MWLSPRHNIEIQRNAVVSLAFNFKDKVSGEPLNLVEFSFRCEVSNGGGLPLIATIFARETDKNLGIINFDFDGADFSAVEGNTEQVNLAYNIIGLDGDGKDRVFVRGILILTPGI